MKKIITSSMALLSVVVLAACSGKTTSDSSTKTSSSSVEQTSSSETSSTTSSSKTENNEVVLITVGDVKKVFGKLVDNYKKHAVEIGEKIPESGKEAYNAQVEPALKSMETVRESFNESLSSIGSDDTVVPEQTRTLFVQQLKTGRDTMKKALEAAYKAVAPYTSGQ